MKNNSNGPRRSPVPLIIGAVMILAVIALKLLSKEEVLSDTTLLFLGVLVVVGGFAAVIINLSIKKAREKKFAGDGAEKKPLTASDIAMYIFAGIGGVGLLGLLWSLVLADTIDYKAVFIELIVFVVGFSVTYNIFMKKKHPELSEDNEGDKEEK